MAATLYHLFLAEDNSPELFAQFKRIHSLVPYGMLKNVIRIANPAAVMAGVLDLFLGPALWNPVTFAKSLLTSDQRRYQTDRTVRFDDLTNKIGDPVLTNKLRSFIDSTEETEECDPRRRPLQIKSISLWSS